MAQDDAETITERALTRVLGYVDPVDLAHSMTAQGFNVRGVRLPLIGQPVEDAHQGLARQVCRARMRVLVGCACLLTGDGWPAM